MFSRKNILLMLILVTIVGIVLVGTVLLYGDSEDGGEASDKRSAGQISNATNVAGSNHVVVSHGKHGSAYADRSGWYRYRTAPYPSAWWLLFTLISLLRMRSAGGMLTRLLIRLE